MAGLIAAITLLASVALAAAQDVTSRTFTVSGRIVSTDGTVPAGLSVMVFQPAEDGSSGASCELDSQGHFRSDGLPPGTYILSAAPRASDLGNPAAGERGYAAITITDADIVEVVITTARGATVRGRVQFGDAETGSRPKQIVVHASLAITEWLGPFESATVADDGTFELPDVRGPRIVRIGWLGMADGARWWFASAHWNGRDVTNEPVDFFREAAGELTVVFSQRPTAIVGTLEDVAGIPMAGACVMMLPDNRDLHRGWSTAVGTATTDRRGRFHFTGMPPGEYRVEGVARACPDRMSLLAGADVVMRNATAVTVAAQRVARVIVTGEMSSSRP